MTDKAKARAGADYSSGAAELRGEVHRTPEYVTYLDRAVAALRVLRLIVYAGMAGFILLAAYGFFLVFQLTRDVHAMVGQAEIMTEQMQAMTRGVANLNHNVTVMSEDMGRMTAAIGAMDANMAQMTATVTLMERSAASLDRNMSPLTGSMSRMLPFAWSGYPGASPYGR